jgi:hypothetical protein
MENKKTKKTVKNKSSNNKKKTNNKSFLLSGFRIFSLAILLVACLFVFVAIYFSFFKKDCGCRVNQTPKVSVDYINPGLYENNDYIESDFLGGDEKIVSIDNPVTVSGRANVYEATVYIRIVDREGSILADTFATAEGWMDGKYPFSLQVSYDKPKLQGGYIEIFEKNPKDGSESNKVVVPVVFNN